MIKTKERRQQDLKLIHWWQILTISSLNTFFVFFIYSFILLSQLEKRSLLILFFEGSFACQGLLTSPGCSDQTFWLRGCPVLWLHRLYSYKWCCPASHHRSPPQSCCWKSLSPNHCCQNHLTHHYYLSQIWNQTHKTTINCQPSHRFTSSCLFFMQLVMQ